VLTSRTTMVHAARSAASETADDDITGMPVPSRYFW
jgi:hypothetical protein